MSIKPKPGGYAEETEYYVDETDNFYCEYDSTWETKTLNKKNSCYRAYTFENFRRAARDMQNYRHDYPNAITRYSATWHQQEDDMPNLKFYLGQRNSCPDGFSIDDFHKMWFGDYSRLERVHTFIQWLFPLKEPGMNYQAFELSNEEIKAFLENQTAKDNLLKSYNLMLDFYGIERSNEKTGEVKRAHNWQEGFKNLERNTHNNLRITRILKCLGTLGYPHFQAPLVHFFLEETLVHSQLYNIKESVLNYFMFTVLDKQQRRELIKYAFQHFGQGEFVWCPKRIQNIWSKETTNQDCNPGHEGKTQDKSVSKQKTPRQPQDGTNSDNDQDSVTTPPAQPSHQGFLGEEGSNKQRELGDRQKDNMTDYKDGDQLPEDKNINTEESGKELEDSANNSSTGQVPLLQTCPDEKSNTSPTEPSETEWIASGTEEGVSNSISENQSAFMANDMSDQQMPSNILEFSKGQVTETSKNEANEHLQNSDTSREESDNRPEDSEDDSSTREGPQKAQIQTYTDGSSNTTPL